MGKRKDVGGGGGVAGAAAPHRNKRPRPLVEEVDGCGEAGGGQDHPREGAPGASKEMGENKFARALGSTDYQTRERGLAALTRWLAGRAAVEEMDLLKLWKGVFYCFWHSDKAPIQEDLAKRLAETQLQLKPAVAHDYFAAFLKTIRREWLGIDRLRLDKFLLLIRHFLRQMLALLKRSRWDSELLGRYMELLQGCLLPADSLAAAGVAYHLADIWVDELDVVADSAGKIPLDAAVGLLRPFLEALSKSPNQTLITRIRDNVFGAAASRYQVEEGACGALDGPAMAEAMFEAAAERAANQKNRAALYDLNKQWLKAARKRSGGAAAAAMEHEERRGDEAEPLVGSVNRKSVKKAAKVKARKGKFVAANMLDSGTDAASREEGSERPEGKERNMATTPKRKEAEEKQADAEARVKAAGATPAAIKKALKKAAALSTPGEKESMATTPKRKGMEAEEKQADAEARVKAAGATPAAIRKAAALSTPLSAGDTPLKKKKAKQAPTESPAAAEHQQDKLPRAKKPPVEAALGLLEAASEEGPRTPHFPNAAHSLPTQKKSVTFRMKNNLYFKAGGPLPHPDVRTPPPAKPKGPALKRVSAFGGPQERGSKTVMREAKGRPAPLTPRSAPRMSATDFF